MIKINYFSERPNKVRDFEIFLIDLGDIGNKNITCKY